MKQSMTDVQFTAAITHEGEWYVERDLQVEVKSQGARTVGQHGQSREALELY